MRILWAAISMEASCPCDSFSFVLRGVTTLLGLRIYICAHRQRHPAAAFTECAATMLRAWRCAMKVTDRALLQFPLQAAQPALMLHYNRAIPESAFCRTSETACNRIFDSSDPRIFSSSVPYSLLPVFLRSFSGGFRQDQEVCASAWLCCSYWIKLYITVISYSADSSLFLIIFRSNSATRRSV